MLRDLPGCTPNPEQAGIAIERISSAWPATRRPFDEVIAHFGDAAPALAHLLSISPISTEKIIRDPAALDWLATEHQSERSSRQMRTHLGEVGWQPPNPTSGSLKAPVFAPLRRWKQRETLRIALRDVAGVADIEQTTLELSTLAGLCIQEIATAWLADHTRRLGDPGTAFAILGMGKFGAQELNFSSDIDVIPFYAAPGELAGGLTRQEFFARVTQKIIETFSATDGDGALFRIDLRLRPEGDAGPLVRSLDSMENYYAAFGETWERMALSKARLVAGDEELGYEFFQRLQSFIYPRNVGPDMIDEIARIKARIENEIVGTVNLRRNIKLGRGGIREIEFICQSLQLLHGARHAFLQERQTLRALRALRQLDLISHEETDALGAAYRFLRTVEHRLQIESEARTHTLPGDLSDLERLAASIARSSRVADGDAPAFLARLKHHAEVVRGVFDKVMSSANAAPAAADLSFFGDPVSAQRNIADLGQGGGTALISPRSKKLFARLAPQLLDRLREAADPDAALTRFVRFTERYGLRGALFETLLTNPRVLELLVKLFDASAFLGEIAIRRPQLVEDVARLGNIGEPIAAAAHAAGLARNDESLPWRDWLRVYRRAQQLRIGLRDLLGFATLREVWAECTALAEACLAFAQRQLGLDDSLTVIALGKFGGCELGYGADLDVLFIGPQPEAAAALLRAMTETTAEGRVFPMDARLRPEGEKGQLAITLAEWRSYFARGRGELWEAQALTKARPLTGPDQAAWLNAAQDVWRSHGQRADLFEKIHSMLARIAEHRGKDPLLDFKTGPGGLMQLEFFVQARQMRAGEWEPNTLDALARVAPDVAPALSDAYLFLRKVETVLRRMDDTSVSTLPADEREQNHLARRCSLASRDALLARICDARETITKNANLSAGNPASAPSPAPS
jgi:[glutamine synthetase] adenylyltransferase / [glutamine synthetase]-adenylyl-L-tyrosine phosphorylase